MNGLKPEKKVVATNLAVYARGEFIYKDCSRESIKQVMMWPDMTKFQKPCQLYYYQTKVPEISKYGIAASAKNAQKLESVQAGMKSRSQYLIALIAERH